MVEEGKSAAQRACEEAPVMEAMAESDVIHPTLSVFIVESRNGKEKTTVFCLGERL